MSLFFPDGVKPYLGFRSWRVQRGAEPEEFLRPQNNSLFWNIDGPTEAICAPLSGARRKGVEPCEGPVRPSLECEAGCGLYLFHDTNYVVQARSMTGVFSIVGAVLAWGEVIRHGSEGFRAQYAKPIAFYRPEKIKPEAGYRAKAYLETLDIVAQRLGARVVDSIDELQQFGFNHPQAARWWAKATREERMGVEDDEQD